MLKFMNFGCLLRLSSKLLSVNAFRVFSDKDFNIVGTVFRISNKLLNINLLEKIRSPKSEEPIFKNLVKNLNSYKDQFTFWNNI